MTVPSDYLVDRRRLSRAVSLWRALAVIAVFAAVAVGIGRFAAFGGGDYIARLDVENLILDDEERNEAIKLISEDDRAQALIVYINSAGGTVVGGERLYSALRRVAAEKPVVAVMGEVAASAAYMTALAADRIFAQQGTVTGSIGVIFQTAEVTDLLASLGIRPESIKSTPLKAAPSPLEKTTPEARAASQALVDDLYRMFVDMVAERRNLAGERLSAVTDGRVFTGRLALTNGLIDAIGGEKEAIDWLETERSVPSGLPVRPLRPRSRLSEMLGGFGELAEKTFLSEPLTLDGLIAVWQPSLR